MSLLGTDAYRGILRDRIAHATSSVSLVSAYVTVPGIQWVMSAFSSTAISLSVLARWSCSDLVSGASDLGVFDLLRQRGHRLYIHPDIHAKVVLVDASVLLLGSANVTSSGLRLTPGGNREIGIQTTATAEDVKVIDALFADSVEVTPELYRAISKTVESLRFGWPKFPRVDWPEELKRHLQPPPKSLWVAEFPWTADPIHLSAKNEDSSAVEHDTQLFDVHDADIETVPLRHAFQISRVYRWVKDIVRDRGAEGLYFGELTALVHSTLLDDPKPYRREVKNLIANLLNWIMYLGGAEMVVDRPNYSQRIRLLVGDVKTAVEEGYLARLRQLRPDAAHDWPSSTKFHSPHKSLLLIEVFRRIRAGEILGGGIPPSLELEHGFGNLWRQVFDTRRETTMAQPFYHLASDGIWVLASTLSSEVPESDRKSVIQLRSHGVVAWIDDVLFNLLLDPVFNCRATQALLETYFDDETAGRIRSFLELPA